MTFFETDGDAGLLSPVSASPLVAALTGDRAVLAAILKVEAAWAAVLDEAGLAPAGSAAVVAAAADVQRYDVAGLAVRAQGGGNPVIPLLADLREQVRNLDTAGLGAVRAVHTSLTSQDVLDSALMVLAAGAIRELLAELRSATAALAGLAETHGHTLCVARSLTQHSLPYTFGLRAAQWFSGLAAAAGRLEALELPVQTGGAAGTLASGTVLIDRTVLIDGAVLTDGAGPAAGTLSPFDLADRLAARLGLAPVPAPWHTNRLAVTSLGDALAAVTDAAGKMAADVLFLSRPEVAEVAEPRVAGRGVSSAMPQKQNPVLSVLIRSAALQAPALAAQLHLAAANFNDERPDGAWHTNGRPCASCCAWPSAPRCSCANWPKGWRSSPERCAATLSSAARCCFPKPSTPPSHRFWTGPLWTGRRRPGSSPDRETAAAGRRGRNAPGPGCGAGGHLPGTAPRRCPGGAAQRRPA